jgi:hypothetical protein
MTLGLAVGTSAAEEPKSATTPTGTTTAPTTQSSSRMGVMMETRMSARMGAQATPPQAMTVWFEGGRTRTDAGTFMSSIHLANGDLVSLTHQNRTYTTMSAAAIKEAMERMGALNGGVAGGPEAGGPPVCEFTPTGKQQTIGEHKVEAYTLEMTFAGQKTKSTFWFAPDYPDADAISAAMPVSSIPGLPFKMGTPPKGVVLRIEMPLPGGGSAVTDTISIKRVEIDDAIFQVPADYKKASSPMMPMPK